jgi:hypothetical protein
MADEFTKLTLQADEFKQANGSVEFNEQIDIAVISTFIADERTEQRQTSNAEGIQHRAAIAQCRQPGRKPEGAPRLAKEFSNPRRLPRPDTTNPLQFGLVGYDDALDRAKLTQQLIRQGRTDPGETLQHVQFP